MYTLGIDTATQVCSVALYHFEKKLMGESWQHLHSTHSESLLPLIDQLLTNCHVSPHEIDCVIVNQGPGSFTGLRIGLAFAKGFCLTHQAILKSVNSLDLLAYQAGKVSDPIVACLDAKNRRIYAAVYQAKENGVEQLSDYWVGTLEEMVEKFHSQRYYFIGDALESYPQLRSLLPLGYFAPMSHSLLSAKTLCERAPYTPASTLSTLEPFYLLKTQAELQLLQKEKRDEKNKEI